MYRLITIIFFILFPILAKADGWNKYLFIENNIDNEYFITPVKLDPRFSGSNIFTKYSGKLQLSLGYMGDNALAGITSNSYVDIWLENSPIDHPFIGNRCMNSSSYCQAAGHWQADYQLSDGAYRIHQTSVGGESGYARGVFSMSAYEYFKKSVIDVEDRLDYRYCYIKDSINYDPSKGETCKSKGGKSGSSVISVTKLGHLKLNSTNGLQEIFVDSNGNPDIISDSQFCALSVVGKVNGITCKLVDLNFYGSLSQFPTGLKMVMKIDTSLIGFTPSSSDIQYSSKLATSWSNWNSSSSLKSLIDPSIDGFNIFFSTSYLKKLINAHNDLNAISEAYTFYFTNDVTPQSGFYEFSPSNKIIIKPKEYSISIVPTDYSYDYHLTGEVNSTAPIQFNYTITTSSEKQADSIIARVSGPNKMINSDPYCIFTPPDDSFEVPFSAYLSFINNLGSLVSIRTSCDEQPIELKDALWTVTPWNGALEGQGYYHQTRIDLTFPMNEARSSYTVDNQSWEGSVSASGAINVIATWNGS